MDSKAPRPKLGFIGVGTMNAAIVRGLCSLPTEEAEKIFSLPLYLSPRNAENAAKLYEELGLGGKKIKVCAKRNNC
jgi:pyrroline-5-carboxylate reductase